jgi:hypothetical protein
MHQDTDEVLGRHFEFKPTGVVNPNHCAMGTEPFTRVPFDVFVDSEAINGSILELHGVNRLVSPTFPTLLLTELSLLIIVDDVGELSSERVGTLLETDFDFRCDEDVGHMLFVVGFEVFDPF